jgi:hypothetical protein
MQEICGLFSKPAYYQIPSYFQSFRVSKYAKKDIQQFPLPQFQQCPECCFNLGS